ncbi:ribosomal protein S18-alanine N-acetyltransferase [Emcibacter sp.]|uniref:ribosomal protein S18-alanine N-acetyltransferase n=1 Tax=Emcibacter sp. TaxID=1979954 RepID=UPI002AA7ECE3|nr:ribosomal protein S18-alanine N-acetyltransferase [Emcibacter sp.]
MTGHAITFQIMGREAAGILAELHDMGFSDGPERVWTEQEFETLLAMPGTFTFLALRIDVPVGFVLVRQVADEAEILTITIVPEFRQQGLASEMMAHVREFLGNQFSVNRLFLEVRADNVAARALYDSQGFQEVGRRKNYYSGEAESSQDAVVMASTLK